DARHAARAHLALARAGPVASAALGQPLPGKCQGSARDAGGDPQAGCRCRRAADARGGAIRCRRNHAPDGTRHAGRGMTGLTLPEQLYCIIVLIASYALRGSTGFGGFAAMPLLALV